MLLSWVLRFFLVLYILALVIWLVGTFGLFGADEDPISGVFLVLLGLPWTLLVDYLPEISWPFATAITPAINVGLVFLLRKVLR